MKNVFLFFGDDKFSLETKINFWEKEFAKKYGDFGINKIHANNETSIKKIIYLINSNSLFSEKKLILIFDFLQIKDIEKNKIDSLKKNLETNKDDSIIVFIETKTIDKRKAFYKFLQKNAKIEESKNPKTDYDYLKFLQIRFNIKKVKISKENINFLYKRVGKNTQKLEMEAEKIANFAGGEVVKKEDIKAITYKNHEDEIWNFTDSISTKNFEKIIKGFENQVYFGSEITQIFFMIVRQFRLFLEAKINEKKESKSFSRIHPFVRKKLNFSIKKLEILDLKKNYKKLLKIDIDLKTGKIKNDEILKLKIKNFLFKWSKNF